MARLITNNAEVLALEADQSLSLLVQLVNLAPLSTAPDMFTRLRTLRLDRMWACYELNSLMGFSWVAGALVRLRDSLLPGLQQNAAGLHSCVEITQLCDQLIESRKTFGFKISPVVRSLHNLAKLIKSEAAEVVSGTHNIAQFQVRIPGHIPRINAVLAQAMVF